MIGQINQKPGLGTVYSSQPRNIFYQDEHKSTMLAGPLTVDGTATSNAANAPYTWHIFAGTLFGRNTTSKKYESSIIGLTTAAYVDNQTQITVSTATAAEIVRRIGNAGAFKLIGPPAAAGTVATTVVNFTAVNVATGVITVPDLNVNVISGAIIAPNNTASTPATILVDPHGLKVSDVMNANRVDVFSAKLWGGGGVINTAYIVDYPADASLQAFVKAGIRTIVPDAKFSDDIVLS